MGKIKSKHFLLIMLICLVSALLGALFVSAQTSYTFTISGGQYPGGPDYTVYPESGLFYIKDEYGVKIGSGSTNAATVFNTVFGLMSAGDSLYVRSGEYDLGVSSVAQPSGTTVYGDGYGTHVYGSGSALFASNSLVQNLYMRLEKIRFDGDGSNTILVNWVNTKQCWITDCMFFDSTNCMIKLSYINSSLESFYNYVTKNYFELGNGVYQPTDYSVAAVWSQGDNIISDNCFDNYPNQYNMFMGIYTANAGDVISNNHITHAWIGVRASSADAISNNYFDTCKQSGVSISGKQAVIVKGNTFLANPSESYYYAIDIGGVSSHCIIEGNTFNAMATEDYFVVFGVSASNCTLIGNSFIGSEFLGSAYNNLGSDNVVSLNSGAS